MTYRQTGKSSFKCLAKTAAYGDIEWTEDYTDEGLTIKTHAKKSGAKMTEVWERKIKQTGWFKTTKLEGTREYAVACGELPFTWAFLFEILLGISGRGVA